MKNFELSHSFDDNYNVFEKIKHIDENNMEFWYARELQVILKYAQWRRFEDVINKAKISCEVGGFGIVSNFANVGKIVKTGVSSKEIIDYKLTRYACYLIAMNGDSRKKVIAEAQTYFAVKTRRQEISEKEYHLLTEDEKRFYQRNLTKKGNPSLNQVAKRAGVKNFDKFHNAGYKGLYNGETAADIAKRKNLRYREEILDNMGSDELASNIFRISQTEQKLKKDSIKTEGKANEVHNLVGKKVRKIIEELDGTMPEELPTPKKSLKQIQKENKGMIK